jgi:sigma-B regulation protein RsbU (phosphoserine phosphatase)
VKPERTRRTREPLATTHAGRTSARAGTDFRILCRRLEDALAQIARTDNISQMLEAILGGLLERFEEELGFEGGRIYRREGDDYYLCCGFGKSRDAPIGLRVPRDYPPHVRTLAEGLLIMRREEPGFNPVLEKMVGVSSTFAAIAVGEGNTHVISFSIKGEVREEQILYSLTAVRYVINLKLEQQKVTGILEESRIVHETILPTSPPVFEGYDIDGRSRAAEIVAGDLFDYMPLPDGRLGIAVGDSSGHGLPAALLARDVITGLRMGTGGPAGLVPVIERLNRLINRVALSSSFVSLFYAELDRDGTLVYCNAGHNPPLHFTRGEFVELDRGGTVLGVISTACYESASVNLETGDVIVMYTDGVIEHQDRHGEMYGPARLGRLVSERVGTSAREIVEAILLAVDAHGGGEPPVDDLTVVALKKT